MAVSNNWQTLHAGVIARIPQGETHDERLQAATDALETRLPIRERVERLLWLIPSKLDADFPGRDQWRLVDELLSGDRFRKSEAVAWHDEPAEAWHLREIATIVDSTLGPGVRSNSYWKRRTGEPPKRMALERVHADMQAEALPANLVSAVVAYDQLEMIRESLQAFDAFINGRTVSLGPATANEWSQRLTRPNPLFLGTAYQAETRVTEAIDRALADLPMDKERLKTTLEVVASMKVRNLPAKQISQFRRAVFAALRDNDLDATKEALGVIRRRRPDALTSPATARLFDDAGVTPQRRANADLLRSLDNHVVLHHLVPDQISLAWIQANPAGRRLESGRALLTHGRVVPRYSNDRRVIELQAQWDGSKTVDGDYVRELQKRGSVDLGRPELDRNGLPTLTDGQKDLVVSAAQRADRSRLLLPRENPAPAQPIRRPAPERPPARVHRRSIQLPGLDRPKRDGR